MKKDYSKKDLAIFASYYRPHLKLFIGDMACALFIALVDLAFPTVTRTMLQTYLPNEQVASFVIFIVAAVIIYIIRAGALFFVNYWGHGLGVEIEADMRRDAFAHLQRMSFDFFDGARTGRLLSSVTTDLFDVTELAHHGPEDLFISLVTLVGAFIFMMLIQWKLALILLISLVVLLAFCMWQRRKMSEVSSEVKKKVAMINSDVESSLSGIRVSRAFGNESYESEKFKKSNGFFVKSKKNFYLTMGFFQASIDFLNSILYVIIVGVGGLFILKGEMDLLSMTTFLLYVNTFTNPIKKLANFMEQYESGMAGFKRFVQLMRQEPSIQDKPNAVELKDIHGDIEFKDVTFAYGKGKNILEDVNLSVHEGQTLALVGSSGGGKTTICQLIPRFYDVSKGAVLIDNHDVRDVTLDSLRGQIGVVQQDMYLFADTICENIRYGRLDATQDEIMEAAKQADIHEFITSLPDGYNTLVGERGILLSGGQKQRICIARIFLKNPKILILDEATSALDTQTEKRVQKALDRLVHGRTTIVIAHRLSTIQNASEIMVVGDQGILERGTHEELIKLEGKYAELAHAQFNYDEEE